MQVMTYIVHQKALFSAPELFHPGNKKGYVALYYWLLFSNGFAAECGQDLLCHRLPLSWIGLPNESQITGSKVHQVRLDKELLALHCRAIDIYRAS